MTTFIKNSCPNCGGSLRTWKCDCKPIWSGYTTSDTERASTTSAITDEQIDALYHAHHRAGYARIDTYTGIRSFARAVLALGAAQVPSLSPEELGKVAKQAWWEWTLARGQQSENEFVGAAILAALSQQGDANGIR